MGPFIHYSISLRTTRMRIWYRFSFERAFYSIAAPCFNTQTLKAFMKYCQDCLFMVHHMIFMEIESWGYFWINDFESTILNRCEHLSSCLYQTEFRTNYAYIVSSHYQTRFQVLQIHQTQLMCQFSTMLFNVARRMWKMRIEHTFQFGYFFL